MALAFRELSLILIAKDQASSVLARVGGAVAILGVTMTAMGKNSIDSLVAMTQEAVEFRQEVALAVTQAENVGATMENVAAISRNVGRTVPTPFEDLNDALFDIFSTLDLDSLEQAEGLLQAFAESAVAGQAPIRDIGRAVIAWMNALDMAPTVENANRLLEIQFELVRKGAGTYGEFAGEVGKSIPAFVNAGQRVETFGGILAFLTRNGMNAAMASTSAARAVELMYSPKAIAGLREIGVAIEDDNGNFRQMHEILRDLVPVFGELTDAERKLKFKEIFGTGRIQARRFFDVAIPNFEELEELIGDMEGSGGELQKAFELMFEQPGTQLQLFTNRWHVLRTEIGDAFIPLMQQYLFPVLDKLLTWWDNLDPAMQTNIARWLGIGAVVLTVLGVITTLTGVLIILQGILKAYKTSLLGVALIGGKVFLAIAALIAIGILLIKHWGTIKRFAIDIWNRIDDAARRFVGNVIEYFEDLLDRYSFVWEEMKDAASRVWDFILGIWGDAQGEVQNIWQGFWDSIAGDARDAIDGIKEIIGGRLEIIAGVVEAGTGVIQGDWEQAWEGIERSGRGFWDVMKGIFKAGWSALKILWKAGIAALKILWTVSWTALKAIAKVFWDEFGDEISAAWRAVLDFTKLWWGRITDWLSGAWQKFVGWWKTVWGTLTNAPGKAFGILKDLVVRSMRGVFNFVRDFFKTAFIVLWDTQWDIIERIPGLAVRAIFEVIKTVLKAIRLFVVGWFKVFNLAWKAFWTLLPQAVRLGFSVAKGFVKAGTAVIRGIFVAFSKTVDLIWHLFWIGLKNTPRAVIAAIRGFWSLGTRALITILKGFKAVFVDIWQAFWFAVKDVFKSVVLGLRDVAREGWGILVAWFNGAKGSFKIAWSGFWATIKQAFIGVWNALRGIAGGAWVSFKLWWIGVKDTFKGLWNGFWGGIGAFFSGIWNALRGLAGGAWVLFKLWWLGVKDTFRALWVGFWNGIKAFFAGVWESIKTIAFNAMDWIKRNILDPLFGWLGDLLGLFGDVGSEFQAALGAGFPPEDAPPPQQPPPTFPPDNPYPPPPPPGDPWIPSKHRNFAGSNQGGNVIVHEINVIEGKLDDVMNEFSWAARML